MNCINVIHDTLNFAIKNEIPKIIIDGIAAISFQIVGANDLNIE